MKKTKSRTDFLQEIVRKYQQAGNSLPANPKDIAEFAIKNRLWEQKPEAIVSLCADQIARAMSMEYFEDATGNRIRAKHAVVYAEGPKQYSMWDDIRTAEHPFVSMALQQRRKHIVNECKQLKNDADYYNASRNPPRPVQIVFNFELDLEEMELAKAVKAA